MPSSCGDDGITAAFEIDRRSDTYSQLLYKALARTAFTGRALNELAIELLTIIDRAHAAREIDAVKLLSDILLGLPISERLKAVARYYQGVCLYHEREFDRAQRIFETAVEEVAISFRGRALHALGLTYHDQGLADESVPIFVEALKVAREYDPLSSITSHWILAIDRSIRGDHKQALTDLENLFPLVQTVSERSATFYDYLNSYAVELGHVGRIDEANAALNVALASPFAAAYPYWKNTQAELAEKRNHPARSFIALSSPRKTRSEKTLLQRKRSRINLAALRQKSRRTILEVISFRASAVLKRANIQPPASLDWFNAKPTSRAPPVA